MPLFQNRTPIRQFDDSVNAIFGSPINDHSLEIHVPVTFKGIDFKPIASLLGESLALWFGSYETYQTAHGFKLGKGLKHFDFFVIKCRLNLNDVKHLKELFDKLYSIDEFYQVGGITVILDDQHYEVKSGVLNTP